VIICDSKYTTYYHSPEFLRPKRRGNVWGENLRNLSLKKSTDRTDEIEEMVRGPIDEVVRDAIARFKEEQKEERERLEQIKDEQKRRARERQRDGVEC
jgi:parvulin-like peptidyl-prolyl isomerase